MNEEQNQVTIHNTEVSPVPIKEGLLFNVEAFNQACTVAKILAASTMIPAHFKNNIGNCIIALNYAARTGVDPFMVMQKMYVINGKPAIETQLQVALFNASGKFTPLRYKLTGEGDKRQCVAIATDKRTGEEIEGPVVSLEMAKLEKWGCKWETLPELMLRYRSATFFIRLYSPETTLGLYTKDEMEDIQKHKPEPQKPARKQSPLKSVEQAKKLIPKATTEKPAIETTAKPVDPPKAEVKPEPVKEVKPVAEVKADEAIPEEAAEVTLDMFLEWLAAIGMNTGAIRVYKARISSNVTSIEESINKIKEKSDMYSTYEAPSWEV